MASILDLLGVDTTINKNNSVLGDGTYQFGDIINTLQYLGKKSEAGALSGVENITDAASATLAQLFGNNEKATQIYTNNWSDKVFGADYSNLDTAYNVTNDSLTQKAGELSSSVADTLIPVFIGVGLSAVTGGAAAPLATGTFFTKALGSGTAQAVQETGELGAKENIYGIGTAVMETGIEMFLGNGIAGLASKAATSLAPSLAKSFLGSLGGSMITEGIEEVASTWLDPYLQRATYNQDAEAATLDEIKDSFVQGALISGILQGGSVALNSTQTAEVGKNIKATETGVSDLIFKAEAAGIDVSYEKKVLDAGESVSNLKLGKLATEVNQSVMQNYVDKVKEDYAITDTEEATQTASRLMAMDSYMLENNFAGIAEGESLSAIQTAVDNGTVSAHEVVQMYALAKDSGATSINFEYNETSPYKGNTADGGMTINLAQGKFGTAVHETTHLLESSADYQTLKSELLAIDSEVYKKVVADTTTKYQAYAEQTGNEVDIDGEVVAELAKAVVANPQQFLDDIEYNPTITQKIADIFKNILKNFKSMFNTAEQNQIQKAYDTLVKAVKNQTTEQSETKTTQSETKTTTATPVVQYDIEEVLNNSEIKRDKNGQYLDINLESEVQKKLDKEPLRERRKFVEKYIKENFRNIQFRFVDGLVAVVTGTGADKIKNTKLDVKQRASLELKKLVEISIYDGEQLDVEHTKFDNFYYYKARIKLRNEKYDCDIVVGFNKKENLYQIYDINKITKKDETSSNNGNPSSSANRTTWDVNVSSTDSILNKTKKVNPHSQNNSKNNTKYDLADDFRELTDADAPVEYKKTQQNINDAKSSARNVRMFTNQTLAASENINSLINETLEELTGSSKFATISKNKRKNILYDMLLTVIESDQTKKAEMAEKTAKNILTSIYIESEFKTGADSVVAATITYFNSLKKKLDLRSMEGEFKSRDMMRLYNQMNGGTIGVDELVEEFFDYSGHQINAINDADIFFEMYDVYQQSKNMLANSKKILLDKYLATTEYSDLLSVLTTEIQSMTKTELNTMEQKLGTINSYIEAVNELGRQAIITKITGYKSGVKQRYSDLSNKLKNKYNAEFSKYKKTINNMKENARIEAIESKIFSQQSLLKKKKSKKKYFKGNFDALYNKLTKGIIEARATEDKYRSVLLTQDFIGTASIFETVVLEANFDVNYIKNMATMIGNIEDRFENSTSDLNGQKVLKIESENELNEIKKVISTVNSALTKINNVRIDNQNKETKMLIESVISDLNKPLSKVASKFVETKLGRFALKLGYSTLRNDTMFSMLSGFNQNGAYNQIYRDLERGRILECEIKREAQAKQIEFFDKNKQALKGKLGKNAETIDFMGHGLTFEQRVHMFLNIQCNKSYVLDEGMTIESKSGKESNFDVTEADLQKFVSSMSSLEIEYSAILYNAYNTTIKNYGNAKDIELYGHATKTVADYYPIVASDNVKNIHMESFTNDASVENKSFNKQRKGHTRIKIVDATTVFNAHVSGVAQYVAYATQMRAMTALINGKYNENGLNTSVINEIKGQYGEPAVSYLENISKDLQEIKPKEESTGNQIVGFFRKLGVKASLGLNAKVLLNQLMGIPAFFTKIDAKYFYSKNMHGLSQTELKEKMVQYSSVAWDRLQGNASMEVSEINNSKSNIMKSLTAGIGKVDEYTIMKAYEAEVNKQIDLGLSGEDAFMIAGENLNYAIFACQPNSDPLHLAGGQRSANEIDKSLFMFKSDSVKNNSNFTRAWFEYRANPTPETKAAFKKECANMGVQTLGIAVIALMWNRFFRGDDEESFTLDFAGQVFSTFFGGLPYISELYSSIIEGYDVESMGMQNINTLLGVSGSIASVWEDMTEGRTVDGNDIYEIAEDITQTFGIPLRNVTNALDGVLNIYSQVFGLSDAVVGIGDFIGQDYETSFTNRSVNKALSGVSVAFRSAVSTANKITSDKDENGETISGSKKANTIDYIMDLEKFSTVQKLMMIKYMGYAITDDDIKGVSATSAKRAIIQYINEYDLTTDEKIAILERLGYTVTANGTVI